MVDDPDIIPFDFDGKPVRVVNIDGEPWFVGKDVAERLGYANPNKAIGDHCKGVTKRYPLQTPGGEQEVRVIAEPDVLRLIVKSNLPAAERFERLVFEEILPTIRRTGSYGAPAITAEGLLSNPRQLLAITQGYALQIEDMKRDMAIMSQDVAVIDRFGRADEWFGVRRSAKMLDMAERKFIDWLQRTGWAFRQTGSKTLLCYSEKQKKGYCKNAPHSYTKPDGSDGCRDQLVFSMSGLIRIAKLLNVTLRVEEDA